MISSQTIEHLFRLPGLARGVTLKTDAAYTISKWGEEGLAAVQEKTKEWRHEIEYEKIKNTEWVPVGLRILSLLAIREVFHLGPKDIFQMGYAAPSSSFLVKFFLKYFLTLRQTYYQSPQYWKTHYTVGILETPTFDAKKKYLVVRIKNFVIHPLMCQYFAGYFLRIGEIASKNKRMRIQKIHCPTLKNPLYEFTIRWT